MLMIDIEKFMDAIQSPDPYKRYGKVIQVIGLMIESLGPVANIGEVCIIHPTTNKRAPILAEVVGFNDDNVILMPYTEVSEIGSGCLVEATGRPLMIKVGHGLIGKTVDALGNPLDNSALPAGLTDYITERT